MPEAAAVARANRSRSATAGIGTSIAVTAALVTSLGWISESVSATSTTATLTRRSSGLVAQPRIRTSRAAAPREPASPPGTRYCA